MSVTLVRHTASIDTSVFDRDVVFFMPPRSFMPSAHTVFVGNPNATVQCANASPLWTDAGALPADADAPAIFIVSQETNPFFTDTTSLEWDSYG